MIHGNFGLFWDTNEVMLCFKLMDYLVDLQQTVILLLCTVIMGAASLRAEVRLLKDLLTEYDPAARPVKNLTEVVEVHMGVALFQIRELHEKNQFLQINAWFQFKWTDPNLVWNASDYGGLTRLRIPSSRVWVPDIVLYNSVDETKSQMDVFPETNAIVEHDGHVLWVIPAMTKSSCKIHIKYFPFDEQNCPLKFGSWTYDGYQLNLQNLSDTGDLSKYIESGEWDLVGMPVVRNVVFYTCCEEPYIDVTYHIVIRRKPMFFTYNLVFPCVLLMGIGVLVFCLPPESGEKVSLGVTVLLAMTVYQLLIAEAIPPTSEVIPLIGQFFGSTIFLLSFSTAMTVVIMKLHFSGEHGAKVPNWLRKLVLVGLARLVRMGDTTSVSRKAKYPDYQEVNSTLLNHSAHHKDDHSCNMILLNNVMHSNGSANSPMRSSKFHSVNQDHSSQNNPYYDSSERGLLSELVFHVKQINEELRQKNTVKTAEEYYKSEWRMVALVLDRILLIIFFIITVFTCVVIFINVPHGHSLSRDTF